MKTHRTPIRKTALAMAATLALGVAPGTPALAASCTWNPAAGNWNVAANWSCGIVPTGGPDTALIAAGKTVTVNAAQSTLNLNNAGNLNIDAFLLTLNSGGATTNTGTINIGAGPIPNNAALQLAAGHNLNNSGGVINISADSVLNQFGSTITGGVINTTGSGRLVAFNSSADFLSGVTLAARMDMASAFSRQRITNGLTLSNGTIDVDHGSWLSFEGTSTLAGTGGIVLGAGPGNLIALDDNGTTTFAAGTMVRGHSGTIGGQLNIGGTQTLVNNGSISADVAGGTINIVDSAVTNNGALSALNGGTLVLSSNVTGTASGQIVAGAGSTVLQNGVTLGGTLNTSGAGSFRAANSVNNVLDGVTLNGNLDMASGFARQRVTAGGLVLNGTINVDQGSWLSFEGNGGLSGNATVVLGSNPSNLIALDGDGATTFAAGTMVRGHSGTLGGQLNIGGTQTLVNNGSISADVAGGTINIVDSAVTNNGTLSALNGGTLVLSSNVTGTASGQIVAGAGSTVLQNGVTLGGTLNTSGAGLFRAANSVNNFLDGVTLNGNLDMASGFARQRVTAGGLVLNGTINVDQGSWLSFEGNGGLSGNATVVLGSSPSNRIAFDSDGATTFAAGTTVRGHSGTLGGNLNIGGTQTLVNNGTIHADTAGGTFTFTNSALVNNGLVRASAGTANIGVALSGTGTLQVDATGAMTLANGAKTQGRLAMGDAGAAINLGTGNLTLTNDYTNVGAGTGNSFNKRAGVSGTGMIVAGGDAAQAITGANISNGNSANATLTIGHVRVGATTFDYQVANTGTTGPSLRGAIQTSVNGGNLSDARLSGTGVAAGNYHTGAPGSDTGNLGVTFTAANAGALAPLSGQVLNLSSNFSNIADQKLNIVLAGGAAAYNAAVGNAAPSPVINLGNARVGAAQFGQQLTVSNTAAAGAFSEDLNASFAGNTGAAADNGGSINGLLAGAGNNAAMAVFLDTASAGAKAGTVTLNYQTSGQVNGVANGLGAASAGSQVLTVNGNVYQAASGAVQSAPLNFGTVQVGQAVSQNLVIRNTAAGAAGFVEDLNASFGAASGTGAGLIGGSGSLTGILAGNNSSGANGSMTVSVNTGAAGIVNGNIAVNYFTAGAVAGTSNGLGAAAVGSQNQGVAGTIQAQANVINQANPLVDNLSINLDAVRVGAASQTAHVSVTNVATVAPQAALNASIASNGAPVTAGGNVNLLSPGATNNTSLVVGLATGTAGNFTGANAGSATIAFISDAGNVGDCAPNCQLNLASQTVSVSGKVYAQANGQLDTPMVDFGIVRVGDAVASKNISVLNTAAVAGLNDTLRASLGGVNGAFSSGGSVGGVGAQSAGNISVALNTASAGSFNQTGAVSFVSQNADMADVSAGTDAQVLLKAQVNNLADAVFELLGGFGSLSQINAEDYVLDLGNLAISGAEYTLAMRLENQVAGPADDLSGLFALTDADDFNFSGWGAAVNGLDAGQGSADLGLGLMAVMAGQFQDIIDFNGFSTNGSGLDLAQHRRLFIRANVFDPNGGGGNVPEPGTLVLVVMAALAGTLARRGRRDATAH